MCSTLGRMQVLTEETGMPVEVGKGSDSLFGLELINPGISIWGFGGGVSVAGQRSQAASDGPSRH